MRHVVLAAALASVLSSSLLQADEPAFLVPTLTLDPGAAVAATTPPPNPETWFFSVYFENDGNFVHPVGPDKHYTNGVGISFAGQPLWARDVGRVVPSFWDEFNPDQRDTYFATGLVLAQDMYTPTDLTQSAPIYDDRPYAGWLYGGFFWQRAYEPDLHRQPDDAPWLHATMEHLQLDLGMTGYASLAEETQKFVHTHFAPASNHPEGWGNQMHDQLGLNLTYLRKWRFTALEQAADGTPAIQVIPVVGGTAGDIYCNATAQIVSRLGWNLPDDFGPGRLHEMAAFTGPRRYGAARAPVGFYVFGRAAGQAVAYNSLLQGNTWRDSTVTVTPEPLVGELQGGLALRLYDIFELVYSQTLRTEEFRGQQGHDVYGALALTFSWKF